MRMIFILLFNFFIHFQAQAGIKEQSLQNFNAHFQNIVFDARGSRGGNGDVAAAYLTIMDFLLRLEVQSHITILVDENSNKILKNLAKNNFLFWSLVQVETFETLNQNKVYDLYISLASQSGVFKYGSQIEEVGSLAFMKLNSGDQEIKKIKVKKEGVLIVQPVLGNTESSDSLLSETMIRSHGINYKMTPPGLGFDEMGVYNDYIAFHLKDKSITQLVNFLLSEIDLVEDEFSKNSLRKIFKFEKLKNSKIALVYGISAKQTQTQFVNYLKGLASGLVSGTASQSQSESICLITPSGFNEKMIEDPELKKRIVIISSANPLDQMPEIPEPGKIYILKTKTLPHSVFVGLLAYSMKAGPVPLGSGDGFMSAALNLGGPFALTRVDWNAKNIYNLSLRLKKAAQNYQTQSSSRAGSVDFDKHIEIIENVFTFLDLSQVQQLKKLEPVFKNLSGEMLSLSENLIHSALITAEISSLPLSSSSMMTRAQILNDKRDEILDPVLKKSLLLGGKVEEISVYQNHYVSAYQQTQMKNNKFGMKKFPLSQGTESDYSHVYDSQDFMLLQPAKAPKKVPQSAQEVQVPQGKQGSKCSLVFISGGHI